MALSSAVVLSVYSAGYLRTQAAAERFEAEAGQRRPIVPAPAPAVAEASEAAPPTIGAPTATPPVSEAPHPATARAVVAPKVAPAVVAPAAAVAPVTKDVEPSAAPPMSARSVTRPTAPAPAAVAAIAAAPQGAQDTTAHTPVATPAAAAAPAPPAPPAVPAGPRYKDGTYTGWGTSRHGDIEAQVVIVNGRITSATIAQCWTRWPCSWIEALPGQVVARQSPETDFVSGATQSTNAFYYAVVQALGKAALP